MKTLLLLFLIAGVCSTHVDVDVSVKDDQNPPCSENVEDLKEDLADLKEKITHVEEKLEEMEKNLAQLKTHNHDKEVTVKDDHNPPCSENVDGLKEEVADLMEKITHVEAKLQKTEKDLTELQTNNQDSAKVAFSVALLKEGAGNTGPFEGPTPLKYQRMMSNYGDGYSADTGCFVAPVKGFYFFRFQMFSNVESDPGPVLSLMWNYDRVVEISGTDEFDSGSNAAVLPLTVGDRVYVQLNSNRQVYDNSSNNYNTFSGFLLFSV